MIPGKDVILAKERYNLKFNLHVKEEFDFLIQHYSFNIIRDEITFVRYESPLVFVNVYHGRSSYEIGFECGLKSLGEVHRARLPIILQAILGPNHKEMAIFQACEEQKLIFCVKNLARIVKTHCQHLLEGSPAAYHAVQEAYKTEGIELNYFYNIRPVINDADEAWKRKDYTEAKRLYESVKEHLSPLEISRLHYAAKKISSI